MSNGPGTTFVPPVNTVKPSPPARIGTAASLDGVFKITLPGHSVTTLVMTSEVSNRK